MHNDNDLSERAQISNPAEEISEHYRNYLLKYRQQGQLCVGEVFKQGERLAYCESIDVDDAQQYCRQIVDTRLLAGTTKNEQSAPSLTEIISAMRAIHHQCDSPLQALLRSHLNSNNAPISINELKSFARLHSTTEVLLSYAAFSRLLCDALSYSPASPTSGQDPYLCMLIEILENDIEHHDGSSIVLKPKIFEALLTLNAV